MKSICRSTIAFCLASAIAASNAGAIEPPAVFSYQGQLKMSGSPVTDEMDFVFSLWDALEGGREVARAVELQRIRVVNGLFTVGLDFGLDVFKGEPRWLQVAVRSSRLGGSLVTLRPREPMTAAPVALFAISGNQGPPGPPGSSELVLPFSGTNTTNVVALAIGQTGLAGTASFGINNVANTQPVLSLLTTGTGPGLLSISGAGPAVWCQTGAGGGNAGFFKTIGTDNTQAALFALNQASGSAAHVRTSKRENASPALVAETFSDGPAAHFKTHPDANNVNLEPTILAENDQYGPAGVFKIINSQTTATALKAETIGPGLSFEAKTTGAGAGGRFEIANAASSGKAIEAVTNGTGSAASFLSTNTATTAPAMRSESRGNNSAVHAEALGEGEAVLARASLGADAIVAEANGFGLAGKFSVGDPTNDNPAVDITTAGTNAALRVVNTNAASLEAGYFVGRVDVARTSGAVANSVRIQPTSGGAQLKLYDSAGAGTIVLDAELGGVGRITTDEIMINGGSDLSERFDVGEGKIAVEPGTVVCIDRSSVGKLVSCTAAYDKTVAGIVSGAGGVRTGMMMGQEGTLADGAHPVALSGRVYCKVDASGGAVQPGDLLTTSLNPGYAMKVTDHDRANGAMIGKAMSGLAEGQGLVLVLVSLQ